MARVSQTINQTKQKQSSIFLKFCCAFFCLIFAILLGFWSLSATPKKDPSPYSYEELLNQAIYKMEAFEYGRALDILSFAKEKKIPQEYRYFYILGEIYYRMGRISEALQAYDESLRLEPGQTKLLLKIADFHENDRRPHFALGYLKKYLRFLPDDREQLYRAAVLARRSGENGYALSLLEKLESDNPYALEKDSILELIRIQVQNRNWTKSAELAWKYILYFPREEIFHEYLLLAFRGGNRSEVEKAMVNAAAIFPKNANFAVRYGIFLQENERMLEALAAFRRAYRISLYTDKDEMAQLEILLLIRQTYSFLNRRHDARAIAHLAELIRTDRSHEDSALAQAYKTYPKNREILEFLKAFYKKTNRIDLALEMQKKLQERDLEHEETELVFVIGPFVCEVLEEDSP